MHKSNKIIKISINKKDLDNWPASTKHRRVDHIHKLIINKNLHINPESDLHKISANRHTQRLL